MKTTLLAITTSLSLILSTQVLADNGRHRDRDDHYAKVVRVVPVYKTVRISYQVQRCRGADDRGRHNHHTRLESPAKIVLGGLIGGAIGHELGKNSNQPLATITGAVIGTAIAHTTAAVYVPAERHELRREACRTETRYRNEQKLVAYDVTYRHHGQLYTTRTHEHPGNRIRINDHRRNDRDRHHR